MRLKPWEVAGIIAVVLFAYVHASLSALADAVLMPSDW